MDHGDDIGHGVGTDHGDDTGHGVGMGHGDDTGHGGVGRGRVRISTDRGGISFFTRG
jgi:hypothetical protein